MKTFSVHKILIQVFIVCLAFTTAFSANIEYEIGSGDVIKIDVYDHPDLATVARVGNDGSITFPLAGRILVGGLSTTEAAAVIAEKLDVEYIVNPQVSVFIEQFKSKKVVIIGEVNRPGLYELSGPTSLLELISQAGGVTKAAGQKVTITRGSRSDGQQEEIIAVNVLNLAKSGHSDEDVPIQDGDTVQIDKAGVVYVSGQVNRPAAYPLEPDTTVIKAITMAGGFTELAAEGKIKIIRKINGLEKTMERVSLHTPLMPDDIMVVPESFF